MKAVHFPVLVGIAALCQKSVMITILKHEVSYCIMKIISRILDVKTRLSKLSIKVYFAF